MAMPPTSRIIVERDVPATMRDGTVLMATIYRPESAERLPVLLARTPYGKDLPLSTSYLDALRLAQRGYIVVVQDVRGRYASGGDWYPFENEFEDGFDTVAWAANLPGSDGQVGMWGVSYFGMTQWQAAVMGAPGLRALAPGITWGNYLNGTVFRGGARELGLYQYWAQTAIAPDLLLRRFRAEPERLGQELGRLVALIDRIAVGEGYDVLPLRDLPDPCGVVPFMFETLGRSYDHPYYWERLNIEGRYDRVRLPTLHIGGWYDCFIGETLRQYAAMQAQGNSPYLVVGPWTHGRFDSVVGDLSFGLVSSGLFLNAKGDLTDLHLRWCDATLKGRREALERQAPVEIFVMGENRWRTYPAWPVPGAREETWYLHSGGNAATRAGDGTLARRAPGADEPADTYLADPHDPVPTLGGAVLLPQALRPGPRDQGPNEDRPDVLCYTSAPLERDYTVIGALAVRLYAASTAPDTDFVARLVDVYPDGRAIVIADGIIRASARDAYPEPGAVRRAPPSLIEPERVYEYTIDLWATANTFKAGHRLRLEIAGSSFPRWDRNLQTGESSFDSAAGARALQRVFHDAGRPSRLTLSVVEG